MHGTVTTSIVHMMAQGQGTALQDASLTSTAHIEANTAQHTLRLDGQSQLHVERLHQSPDLVLTDVTLTGPWRLSYAPDHWHGHGNAHPPGPGSGAWDTPAGDASLPYRTSGGAATRRWPADPGDTLLHDASAPSACRRTNRRHATHR